VIKLVQKSSDGKSDSVISMSKINSIEYSAFKMTSDLLKKAIERKELEKVSEQIT